MICPNIIAILRSCNEAKPIPSPALNRDRPDLAERVRGKELSADAIRKARSSKGDFRTVVPVVAGKCYSLRPLGTPA
jgi:hypothetical protein